MQSGLALLASALAGLSTTVATSDYRTSRELRLRCYDSIFPRASQHVNLFIITYEYEYKCFALLDWDLLVCLHSACGEFCLRTLSAEFGAEWRIILKFHRIKSSNCVRHSGAWMSRHEPTTAISPSRAAILDAQPGSTA
eukprot:scaffold72960_cov17-Prasinocladus_malaysianus.AAC.1